MKDVVVVVTHNSPQWLDNCLSTLKPCKKYDIIVVYSGKEPILPPFTGSLEDKSNGFEIGAIKTILNHDYDNIFLLHDSVEIKDCSLFDKAFSINESYALSDYPVSFGMYLGKYKRDALLKTGILKVPTPQSKMQSVELESTFNSIYASRNPWVLCDQPIRDNPKREEKFGRVNMVLENDYIKKYKGTWHRSQIKQ